MLKLSSLIKRRKIECPLMPSEETVRKAAKVGKLLTMPLAALDKPTGGGGSFLLGGKVPREVEQLQQRMARLNQEW